MFSFYVTSGALSKMVQLESDEYEILKKQERVYVELDDSEIEFCRSKYNSQEISGSNIFMALETSDCEIKHSDDIVKVKDNPSILSKYAESVFILDINETMANNITAQYGVLVLSQDNIDLSSLMLHDFYSCVKQEQGNWNDVLAKINTIPFNTILINDRNLFKDIYKIDEETHRFGIDNLKSILNAMLIYRRRCATMPIHVFVGFDLNTVMPNFTKLNNEFSKSFAEIMSNYNIMIELVAYTGSSSFWDDSHNRWIITNYGCITMDHKISVFQKDNKANVDQDINYHSLFAMKLNEHNPAKLPKRNRDIKIMRVKAIMEDVLKRPEDYKYSRNGVISTPKGIQNRLLVS